MEWHEGWEVLSSSDTNLSLWRKKWKAKGFNFTLKGECDFKLGDFLSLLAIAKIISVLTPAYRYLLYFFLLLGT